MFLGWIIFTILFLLIIGYSDAYVFAITTSAIITDNQLFNKIRILDKAWRMPSRTCTIPKKEVITIHVGNAQLTQMYDMEWNLPF